MPPKRPKPDGETNEVGGAGRDRTDDLLLAKQALSQLSYGPAPKLMVGPGRFELPTSRLSGVRSNQLSYGPPYFRALIMPVRQVRKPTLLPAVSMRYIRKLSYIVSDKILPNTA